MKRIYAITILVVAGVLALAGCGKSKPAAGPTIDGVTVDMGKFTAVFGTAGPQFQASFNAVRTGVRYGDYASALAELDKLAANPSLTETQKQVVALVTEQIKQVASKSTLPPPQ